MNVEYKGVSRIMKRDLIAAMEKHKIQIEQDKVIWLAKPACQEMKDEFGGNHIFTFCADCSKVEWRDKCQKPMRKRK